MSESAAKDYELVWRSDVRSASIEDLVTEKDLLRILLIAKRDADPSEGPLEIEDSPALTLALLLGARSDAKSQAIGSRAVRRMPRLAWDTLVELWGDEATLEKRVEGLEATQPEDADELLALAKKYLSGWRPSAFGDD